MLVDGPARLCEESIGGDLNSTMPLTADDRFLVGIEEQFIPGKGGVMKVIPGATGASAIEWFYPLPSTPFYEWQGGMVGSVGINDRYSSDVPAHFACFIGVDGMLTVVDHQRIDPSRRVKDPLLQYDVPPPVVLDQVKLPAGSISTPLFLGNRIIVPHDKGLDLFSVSPEGKLLLAQNGEVLFPADAHRADVTRHAEVIEDVLDGTAEVAGLAGDFRRVAALVGQQPGHDFGTRLHAKKRTEFEQKRGRLVRAGSLAQPTESIPAALQAVLEKYRVGLLENGDRWNDWSTPAPAAEIARIRKESAERTTPFAYEELKKLPRPKR